MPPIITSSYATEFMCINFNCSLGFHVACMVGSLGAGMICSPTHVCHSVPRGFLGMGEAWYGTLSSQEQVIPLPILREPAMQSSVLYSCTNIGIPRGFGSWRNCQKIVPKCQILRVCPIPPTCKPTGQAIDNFVPSISQNRLA